jgi:hypothetical protein
MALVTQAECANKLHKAVERELSEPAVFTKFEDIAANRVRQISGIPDSVNHTNAPEWAKTATIFFINYFATTTLVLAPSDNLVTLQELWKNDAMDIITLNKLFSSAERSRIDTGDISTGWAS